MADADPAVTCDRTGIALAKIVKSRDVNAFPGRGKFVAAVSADGSEGVGGEFVAVVYVTDGNASIASAVAERAAVANDFVGSAFARNAVACADNPAADVAQSKEVVSSASAGLFCRATAVTAIATFVVGAA